MKKDTLTTFMSHVQWIWHQFMQTPGWIVLSLVLVVVEAWTGIVAISLQQRFIDEVWIQKTSSFWYYFRIIVLVYSAHLLLMAFAPIISYQSVAKLKYKNAELAMKHLHQLPIYELQRERIGDYVKRMTQDLQLACQFVAGFIPRTLLHICNALLLSCFVAYADYRLLLLVFMGSLMYYSIGRRYAKPRRQLAEELNGHRSSIAVLMEEGVSATREITAFHQMDWERQRYHSCFGRLIDTSIKETKLINRYTRKSDALLWGTRLLVLLAGSLFVVQETLTIGGLVVAYQLSSRLMDSLHQVFHFTLKFPAEIGSLERYRLMMSRPVIPNGSTDLKKEVARLELKQVTFTYPERTEPVLRGLSLQLPIGRKIAFVGASGSGKSTIASLLARLFEIDHGTIEVNGVSLREIRRDSWAKHLAIVFQEPYLFPDSIRTNLVSDLDGITEQQLRRVCRIAEIEETIDQLPNRFDTLIGERGITLSGGQRQRLAIARALLRNPSVLILDEATSALDLETERRLMAKMDQERKGQTTIFIAHRLSTIQNADMICVVEQGRLAGIGNHEQLLKTCPSYVALVKNQESVS